MSIEAIHAIDEYLRRREHGIPVSEIKEKIKAFVEKREARHAKNNLRRKPQRAWWRGYYKSDGHTIVPEKVK